MPEGVPARGDGEGKKLREAARLWARGELISEHQDAKDRAQLDEALAAFGLELEGAPGEKLHPFYLWPEHVQAWRIFTDLFSQWRHGMAGPTGLDYAAVLAHLREGLRLPYRKIRRLYAELRAMEAGALAGFAERAQEREAEMGRGR